MVGPPGIGKTALVDRTLADAATPVRRGAGVDLLSHRALLPLQQVLGRRPRSGDPAAIAEEVRASVGPAVIVLDDLQWADADTWSVVPYLAKNGPLVAICRSGPEAERLSVGLDPHAELITLGPLSDDATREVVAHLRPDADALLVRSVVEHSGGHPLSIEVLCGEGTSSSARRGVTTLHAAIEQLPGAARLVLARAGLRDPALSATADGVDDLVARGLLVVDGDVGAVRPNGELLGEIALATLDSEDRRALHRRLAALATDPADAARHHDAAGDRDLAHLAAREAAANAASLSERAALLALAVSTAVGPVRLDLARELGECLLRLGRPDDAWAVCLEHFGDTDELPLRHRLAVRGLEARRMIDEGRLDEALVLVDDALRSCDESTAQEEYHLRTIRAGVLASRFDVTGAGAEIDGAVRFAADHGLRSTRARSIGAMLGGLVGDRVAFDSARVLLEEAPDDPEPQIAFETGCLLAQVALLTGADERLSDTVRRLTALADALNQRSWFAEASLLEAVRQVLDPRRDDPRPTLRGLLGSPASPSVHGRVRSLLAVAELDRGELSEARRVLASAPARPSSADDRRMSDWANAEIAWHAGRSLELGAPDLSAPALADPAWHHLVVLRRWFVLFAGGDVDACPHPLPLTPSLAGLVAESDAIALLARPGGAADAARRFLDAATAHERCFWRESLRCRWAAGDALRVAGLEDRSRDVLLSLQATCRDVGYVALDPRIERSLRLLGVTTARPSGPSGSALTGRQGEILLLVGDGLSTTEIAALLHLSPATVDTHVRNAMRTLGARTRREAAVLARSESTGS